MRATAYSFRNPVLASFFIILLVLTVQPLQLVSAQGDDPADRPNIIFILTDDQSKETLKYMPAVQAELMAKGMTFDNAFTVTPLCCPARASILRGQYIHNHRVLNNVKPDGGFYAFQKNNLEKSTVATWLQEAGYRTALVGKYLNGYGEKDPTYLPAGWDEWYGWYFHKAYGKKNYYTRFVLNENGTPVHYGVDSPAYTTDVMGDHAQRFVERAATDDVPFFLFLSLNAPHAPKTPAPRHANLHKSLKAPKTPAFNEANVSDKPEWIRKKELLSKKQIKFINETYRNQVLTLLAVDEMVQNLVTTLTETEQLDNTYIIFTTDNGYHFGTHRLRPDKGTAYTEDSIVPLVIRGPGVPQGAGENRIVANIDFAPTFADIAGAAVPDFVDGRSLLPLLTPESTTNLKWRNWLLISYLCPTRKDLDVEQRRPSPCHNQVRTSHYTYITYPATGELEFYNLRSDPYQLDNLLYGLNSTEPGHITLRTHIKAYAAKLTKMLKCKGATCRSLEDSSLP